MRRTASCFAVAIGLALFCQPMRASMVQAQTPEKTPRRALPFFGVKSIERALRNSQNTVSPGPGSSPAAAISPDFQRVMSTCGANNNWSDVELYAGAKPTAAFVNGRQSAVAQIQWKTNLSSLLGNDVDPGNVTGERWCTGTLIAPHLFLTAAHCFEPVDDVQNWQTPRFKQRGPNGNVRLLSAQSLAPLMQLNFRYQVNGNDPQRRLRAADTYPIVRLVEYGFDHPTRKLDYAIVEVGRDAGNNLPDTKYAVTEVDASDAGLTRAALLTIIQHPHGEPKKVMAGPSAGLDGDFMLYKNLDTLAGSSGAGVLAETGRVIGVHVQGGCFEFGGANRGVPLRDIKAISQIIR